MVDEYRPFWVDLDYRAEQPWLPEHQCPQCGKVWYVNQADARQAQIQIAARQGRRMWSYRCPAWRWAGSVREHRPWHITSWSQYRGQATPPQGDGQPSSMEESGAQP